MAEQGWYPDPSGQQGMFRYWDGSVWSETTSPRPLPGPPSQARPTPSPARSSPYASGSSIAKASQQPKTAAKVGLRITAVVGLVVLGLIVYFAGSWVIGLPGVLPETESPTGNPTTQVCPQQCVVYDRADHPVDDRVYGGHLSYPRLPSPWGPERYDARVPFGRDVAAQDIIIHTDWTPGQNWAIWVMVGELNAGDGFYDPQQGSEIVNKCIFGAFYGGAKVTAQTLRSEPYSLDGYDGWITETNLSFSLPGLPTTSELAIVIIIRTSEVSSSIFYATIPNDAMQYMSDVEFAIAGLRVHR